MVLFCSRPKVEKRSPGHSARRAADLTDHSHEECFPFSLDDEAQSPTAAATHSPPSSLKPALFSTSPPNSLLQTHQGAGGAPAKFPVGPAPTPARGTGFVYEEKMKITAFGTSPNGGLGTSPTSRGLQKSQGSKQSGFSSAEDRMLLKDTLNPSSAITSSRGGTIV